MPGNSRGHEVSGIEVDHRVRAGARGCGDWRRISSMTAGLALDRWASEALACVQRGEQEQGALDGGGQGGSRRAAGAQ